MESRRKRKRSQITKWVCYALLMLLCTVLQTLPGLFRLGEAKPLWLLPLALAVAVEEGEFAGGIFGAVCGLMWDYTAGRTAGLLAFELLLLCFLLSAVMQLYFKTSAANVVLLETAAVLLVISLDWQHMELCAHRHRHGPCGALAGLAVLLLHARLQRGSGAVSVVRAAHGGADHPGLSGAVRGSAPHPCGIQDRQRRSLNRLRQKENG